LVNEKINKKLDPELLKKSSSNQDLLEMPDDDIYRSSYLDYTLDESTMCMKKRESNLHESKAESKEDQWGKFMHLIGKVHFLALIFR